MTEIKKAAKAYLSMGWNPVPISLPGKTPPIAWKEFQERFTTNKEIDAWDDSWSVGIVTGKLSGLGVIDIDNDAGYAGLAKLLPDGFKCPRVSTPRGGSHLYCKYTPAIRNKVRKGVDGVDFRGEGGLVVAPPSPKYTWDDGFGPDTMLPKVPDAYIQAVIRATSAMSDKTWTPEHKLFTEGQRNDDLFHAALRLARGKASDTEVFATLKWIAERCDFPESELQVIIKSAFERATREERNLSTEIKNFVGVTDGAFQINDVCRALNIVTNTDRNTLRVVLHRLRKDGDIAKAGKKDGEYIRVDKNLDEIEWWDAPTDEFIIKLPLFINDFVKIYPRNIIGVGGVNDLGKTAFGIDIARHNMDIHTVKYISSEMDKSELRNRLEKWEGVGKEEFRKVKFYELKSNNKIGDSIDPNGLNIIDYLEVKEGEFYKVGDSLADIYDHLVGGVAVVFMQKEPGKAYARGGSLTADKSRLYLSLDIEDRRSVCKVIKSKNFKGPSKPTGKQIYFKVVGGWKIIPDGPWHYPVIGGR
jgi:hypothetical protein